jgi:hypothetical protein
MHSWAKEKLHAAGHRMDEATQKAERKLEGLKGDGSCDSECRTIQKHMDVIASCGKKVGVVDAVEGTSIKLTRKDSPDGNHHLIPESWVDHVDAHVHLNKNSAQTELEWQTV